MHELDVRRVVEERAQLLGVDPIVAGEELAVLAVARDHEHDGLPAQGLGLFLDGRLALFYTYQTDLGDGWEDASVHEDPESKREQALRMGVNIFLYALTASPRL